MVLNCNLRYYSYSFQKSELKARRKIGTADMHLRLRDSHLFNLSYSCDKDRYKNPIFFFIFYDFEEQNRVPEVPKWLQGSFQHESVLLGLKGSEQGFIFLIFMIFWESLFNFRQCEFGSSTILP